MASHRSRSGITFSEIRAASRTISVSVLTLKPIHSCELGKSTTSWTAVSVFLRQILPWVSVKVMKQLYMCKYSCLLTNRVIPGRKYDGVWWLIRTTEKVLTSWTEFPSVSLLSSAECMFLHICQYVMTLYWYKFGFIEFVRKQMTAQSHQCWTSPYNDSNLFIHP